MGANIEINAAMKDLKEAEVVMPAITPFNAPSVRWDLENDLDCHKLNQVVNLMAAAVPDEYFYTKKSTQPLATAMQLLHG